MLTRHFRKIESKYMHIIIEKLAQMCRSFLFSKQGAFNYQHEIVIQNIKIQSVSL